MLRHVSTKATSLLVSPRMENRVVVNFWSPGYKFKEIFKNEHGKDRQRRRFYPTSTTEAALSFLLKKRGSDAYLDYKDDIHPGHCSIATKKHYLSIGTRNELETIGMTTQHRLVYAKDFTREVLAFERFPERRIDFYSLDTEAIDKLIVALKDKNNIYSLFGDRFFGLVDGESCATISHRCLKAGGLDELLNFYRSTISYQEILTPARLIAHAEIAQEQEILTNSKIVSAFNLEFQENSKKLKHKLEEEIQTLEVQKTLASAAETEQERGPRP